MANFGIRFELLDVRGALVIERGFLQITGPTAVLAKEDQRLSIERIEFHYFFEDPHFFLAGSIGQLPKSVAVVLVGVIWPGNILVDLHSFRDFWKRFDGSAIGRLVDRLDNRFHCFLGVRRVPAGRVQKPGYSIVSTATRAAAVHGIRLVRNSHPLDRGDNVYRSLDFAGHAQLDSLDAVTVIVKGCRRRYT